MGKTELGDVGISDLTDMFEWLDELRDGGNINMYGAGGPLAEEFELSDATSRVVVLAWMKSFSNTLPAADRAMNAFDAFPA